MLNRSLSCLLCLLIFATIESCNKEERQIIKRLAGKYECRKLSHRIYTSGQPNYGVVDTSYVVVEFANAPFHQGAMKMLNPVYGLFLPDLNDFSFEVEDRDGASSAKGYFSGDSVYFELFINVRCPGCTGGQIYYDGKKM